MGLSVIILAAGHGKRMNSSLPKVLHTLGGLTMIEHVVNTAKQLSPEQLIVVYGHQGEMVRNALQSHTITWVMQRERLGTGHAAMQALPLIPDGNNVLVLYGDVPMITVETLKQFVTETPKNSLGIVTAYFPDPTGIGRVIRNEKNQIIEIIEEKDADEMQRQIKEVNTGFYFAPAEFLRKWLPTLKNLNAQQEYYLTDIIAMAVKDSFPVHGMILVNYQEAIGINNLNQLAEAENYLINKN